MESLEDQPQPPAGTKKVAIVGFAESWKEAPFKDPSVEIWGLNELHKYVPRWDRWFELHDDETLGVSKRDLSEGEVKRHLDWLKTQPVGRPIYMQPQFCDGRFPAATKLPLDDLIQRFGRYFTSTIGYMVGLALLEDYDELGLYGVDLASDVEYPAQRPNTEYLIGLARGMGKTVTIANGSALLKAGFLYGYEKPAPESPVVAFALKQIEIMKKKHEEVLAQLNTLDGAIQANENLVKAAAYATRGCDVATI
jgi:hypothetical protein